MISMPIFAAVSVGCLLLGLILGFNSGKISAINRLERERKLKEEELNRLNMFGQYLKTFGGQNGK